MYAIPTYFPRLSTGANSLIPAVPMTSAKPAPTPVIAIPPIATLMRFAVPTILFHQKMFCSGELYIIPITTKAAPKSEA